MGGRGRKHESCLRKKLIILIEEAQKNGARLSKACAIIGISQRSIQRWKHSATWKDARKGSPKSVPKKLTEAERKEVIEIVNRPCFASLPPSQIVPILAEGGTYICSERSFYRILHECGMQHHRGKTKVPQPRNCPRLVATKKNQVYSWDITFLPTNVRGLFYYLYLYVDIFSRYIVGWHIDERQDNIIAAKTLYRICKKEKVKHNELTLHADNGGPMKGATMLATMSKLGVIKSFSRPATSNDNPYSEALFKTVKYCPMYPKKPFASLQHAIEWMEKFVRWYNHEHRHSGIGFVTPCQKHSGKDKGILARRTAVYEAARQKNPLRWAREIRKWEVATAVYINPI